MRAIVQHRYGAPSALTVEETARPEPGPGQVLVRVHATSVNARDWHLLRGDPYLLRLAFGLGVPKIRVRGSDVAGRIEAVGAGVTALRPGDEVYGDLRPGDGAFAEYACGPAGAFARKPAGLTFAEAAAVPLAGSTALVLLRDVARVEPGHRVLINGASGGVGTFAVQIAKSLGAQVTAVCSTRNGDLVRTLGADEVVDYTRQDFSTSSQRYDVVLDLVGNRTLTAYRRILTLNGVLVLSGGGVARPGRRPTIAGPLLLIGRGQVMARLTRRRILIPAEVAPSAAHLDDLRRLIDAGGVRPIVDRTYPLASTAEAIRYIEEEHARAKVVITG